MKFKKKDAIKPGMVIHCPTEEDARALLEHLAEIRNKDISWIPIKDDMYIKNDWEHGVGYMPRKSDFADGIKITEFSDLIEPDPPINSDIDSPMSAVEVLEWFRKATTKEFEKLFSSGDIEEVFDYHTNDEIVRIITAYEAAKTKPVELEWVNYCKIIDYQSRECVQETELENGGRKVPTERMLKEYVTHHGGDYYAVVERRCRVKGERDEE